MFSRRRFLKQTTAAGAAAAADLSLGRWARAQAQPAASPARIYIDPERKLATIDRNLFGSFLEHLGRAIYEGIYDPGSSLSDANGFRKDVMDETRRLGVPIVRYPGGNFVSGYNWRDGIGPKQDRPRVLDKAWNTLDSNQFGTDEFMAWCKAVGTEPLMGLNLGTGTPEQAAALVEYCNVEKGTEWSELRRKNGVAAPYEVKHWCLGNEMDGPWQIGHMPATEYGLKAADAARQMRDVDSSLQLVACGSSGPGMPTYLEWDRQVLEQCYDYVDGLSLHRYLGNDSETGGDSSNFLAMNLSLERQIEQTAAVCDVVQAEKRSKKKLWLSFDEWNVWYRARGPQFDNGHRTEAPHLLEEIYNLEDALLVGGILNSLIRHAARIRIACLAQLVNVIAPIMTNKTGLFRQTICYPYGWALQFARGDVLDVLVESPTYDVVRPRPGQNAASNLALGSIPDRVPYIDATATLNPQDGSMSLFVLNRDLTRAHEVEVIWEATAPARVSSAQVLTGDDLKAGNSFEQPNHVVPQSLPRPAGGASGRTRFEVPARSYTLMQWSS